MRVFLTRATNDDHAWWLQNFLCRIIKAHPLERFHFHGFRLQHAAVLSSSLRSFLPWILKILANVPGDTIYKNVPFLSSFFFSSRISASTSLFFINCQNIGWIQKHLLGYVILKLNSNLRFYPRMQIPPKVECFCFYWFSRKKQILVKRGSQTIGHYETGNSKLKGVSKGAVLCSTQRSLSFTIGQWIFIVQLLLRGSAFGEFIKAHNSCISYSIATRE